MRTNTGGKGMPTVPSFLMGNWGRRGGRQGLFEGKRALEFQEWLQKRLLAVGAVGQQAISVGTNQLEAFGGQTGAVSTADCRPKRGWGHPHPRKANGDTEWVHGSVLHCPHVPPLHSGVS